MTMRIAYDKETHGLLVRLRDGKYDTSEEVAPGVVVDFDAAGAPLGFELEDARGLIDEQAIERMAHPRIGSGRDLRAFRDRLGLTQQQLSAALEIPVNTIARWERDEMPIEKRRLLELALTALVWAPEPGQQRLNARGRLKWKTEPMAIKETITKAAPGAAVESLRNKFEFKANAKTGSKKPRPGTAAKKK
jgi:transcriptional regulator with XRE-family HTH domain